MGNQCCSEVPHAQHANHEYPGHQKEILLTPIVKTQDYNVRNCQICNNQRSHQYFKQHLDACHYANMLSQNLIICLICDNRSQSIRDHGQHVKNSHPEMIQYTNYIIERQKVGNEIQLNSSLKKAIEPVSKLEIFMNKDGRTAQIQNDTFDVYIFQRIYQAGEYTQSRAKGDLIWNNIFKTLRTACYYNIQTSNLEKTVSARGKIFVLRDYVAP